MKVRFMATFRKSVCCVLTILVLDSVFGLSPWRSTKFQATRSSHQRHSNKSFHRTLTISGPEEQSWSFGGLFSNANDRSTKILVLPSEFRASESEEITSWNDLALYNPLVRDISGLRAANQDFRTLTCEVRVKSMVDFCQTANLVIKTLDGLQNNDAMTKTDSLCTQDLSVTKFSYSALDGFLLTLLTENPALLEKDALNLTCRTTSGCSKLYSTIKGETVLHTPDCVQQRRTTNLNPSMLRWVITSDDYECNLADKQGQLLGINYVCKAIGDVMVGGALEGLESLCKAREAGTYSSPYATLEGKISGQMVLINRNDVALDLTLVCLS